jgi:hypothetical protein
MQAPLLLVLLVLLVLLWLQELALGLPLVLAPQKQARGWPQFLLLQVLLQEEPQVLLQAWLLQVWELGSPLVLRQALPQVLLRELPRVLLQAPLHLLLCSHRQHTPQCTALGQVPELPKACAPCLVCYR